MNKSITFAIAIAFLIGVSLTMFTDNELLTKVKSSISHSDPESLFSEQTNYRIFKAKNETLSDSHLAKVIIENINFQDVEAFNVNWSNVTIHGGSITSSRLADSTFNNIVFENVTFTNFNVAKSKFNNVTFRNCTITDDRGAHIFFKSFNHLTGKGLVFEYTEINGMMLDDSAIDVVFNHVKAQYLEVSLVEGSELSIKNSNILDLDGDTASLSSLTIENSTFHDSKFNDIRADEVSIIKLKGGLPITGDLGNVTIRHLETDNGRAIYLGDSTINNLSINSCNIDSSIYLMDATIYNLEISNCNLDTLYNSGAKFGLASISNSTVNTLKMRRIIGKKIILSNVTVNNELTANLAIADEYLLENFKLSPNAKIDTTGSNIEWKENARSEKK